MLAAAVAVADPLGYTLAPPQTSEDSGASQQSTLAKGMLAAAVAAAAAYLPKCVTKLLLSPKTSLVIYVGM